MKSILITGGAGFVGSNFVRAFVRRYPKVEVYLLDALTYAGDRDNLPPTVLDRPNFHFWYGNVCNPALVNNLMKKVDTVIHFAAESHVARSIFDNSVFFQTDVIGTQVIANGVVEHRKNIKRFIHISTSEVYGTAETEPMAEEHPLNPATPYASAKCGADRLVYSYYKSYGIPAVIIRPFNQYGPNQHLEKCVPRFITRALIREPLTIHGDGTAGRDWCYVKDTCRALLSALEAPLDNIIGEVINLGTGVAVDVQTIAHAILDMTAAPNSLIEHVPDRPGQVRKHISSTDKAARLLEWKANVDLDTGLEKTIEWYSENEAWWRKREWMKTVPLKTFEGLEVNH